jgi:septum formation protein
VVLASSSPRRLDLLRSIGVEPEVRPADIDETPLDGEAPGAYVERLARGKASAVAGPGEVVVAADTTVVIDGRIIGKPLSRAEALDTLRTLSGRTHTVYTGVAVFGLGGASGGSGGSGACGVTVTSEVTFVKISEEVLDWYVDSPEPYDKAGAYGLQGAGAMLVASVQGSVSNVLGLPLAELHDLMLAR